MTSTLLPDAQSHHEAVQSEAEEARPLGRTREGSESTDTASGSPSRSSSLSLAITWNDSNATLVPDPVPSPPLPLHRQRSQASIGSSHFRGSYPARPRSSRSSDSAIIPRTGPLAPPSYSADSCTGSRSSGPSIPKVNGKSEQSFSTIHPWSRFGKRSGLHRYRRTKAPSAIDPQSRWTMRGFGRSILNTAVSAYKHSTHRASRRLRNPFPTLGGYSRLSVKQTDEPDREVKKSLCPVLPMPNLGESFIGEGTFIREGTESATYWREAMDG